MSAGRESGSNQPIPRCYVANAHILPSRARHRTFKRPPAAYETESKGIMEIRKLSEAELEQALAVWSQAFEHGDRMMRDWKEWEEVFTGRMATYGVFDTSGLQATVLVVDYRVHFGADRVIPMAGVCGVACLPAARGKGYASEGVRYALAQMRANGHFLSILEPFHWGFYQNLGWDWVGVQR